MAATTAQPIQPLISISQRRGQHSWVVYASESSPPGVSQDDHYKLLEKRFPGFRSPRSYQPGAENWERFDATNTLALVVAEGSSGSQDQAVADAMQAAREAAPDLLPARVQLLWTHGTTVRRTKVKQIPSAAWANGVVDARKILRKLNRLEKLAETNTESGSAAPRYVYCRIEERDYDGYRFSAAIHRHRIQRETKALVFVEEESDWRNWGETFEDSNHFRGHSRNTCRLKRSWIDGTEEVPHSVRRKFGCWNFGGFAWREEDLKPLEAPSEKAARLAPPIDLQLLELNDQELTIAKAKAAYRRLAKKHHPDVGGDAALFAELDAAYKRLMRCLA